MRILITNERLDQRAGSDLFIRDLARGLQGLGHFVIAYSSDPREQSRLLERDSISVATDLEQLPFRPDIIHARHHLDAITAVTALPGVPAIHHCIGPAWSIALPVHPRIYRYIAPSSAVAEWIAERGIPAGQTVTLHNAVDLLRFTRIRQPSTQPQRVLIYDDLLFPNSPAVIAIGQAAANLGIRVGMIGRRLGRMVDSPEARLPDYDIVCASGRKAIEALACGCAVVVVAPANCGGLVDEGNFDRLRDADFSADVESPAISVENVRQAFERSSAELSARLTAKARSICNFSTFAARVEAVYLAAIAMHDGYVEDLDAEQRAASAYLETLSPLINQMDRAQKREDIKQWGASMLFDVSAKLAAIQADLDMPSFW
jgi:hypothetical protein